MRNHVSDPVWQALVAVCGLAADAAALRARGSAQLSVVNERPDSRQSVTRDLKITKLRMLMSGAAMR